MTTGRRNRFISPAYIFYNTAPVSKTHYIAVYCRVQRQPFDSVIRPVSYILDGALDRRGRVINDRTFSDEFVPNLVSTMFVEAISWWLEQGRPYTPKEIATRCALLASALFKEASSWQ